MHIPLVGLQVEGRLDNYGKQTIPDPKQVTMWKIATFVSGIAAFFLFVGGVTTIGLGIKIIWATRLYTTPMAILQISAGALMLLSGFPQMLKMCRDNRKNQVHHAQVGEIKNKDLVNVVIAEALAKHDALEKIKAEINAVKADQKNAHEIYDRCKHKGPEDEAVKEALKIVKDKDAIVKKVQERENIIKTWIKA